jgi:hypothetical protein
MARTLRLPTRSASLERRAFLPGLDFDVPGLLSSYQFRIGGDQAEHAHNQDANYGEHRETPCVHWLAVAYRYLATSFHRNTARMSVGGMQITPSNQHDRREFEEAPRHSPQCAADARSPTESSCAWGGLPVVSWPGTRLRPCPHRVTPGGVTRV